MALVEIECGEGVAVLTLNRPAAMNALSRALQDALYAAVDQVDADPAVRVVIVTPPEGARRLATSAFGPHVRVVVDRSPDLPGGALRVAAADLGARVVLCEGGPHVLAELVAERRVDELFLTLAPQLVGRATGVERLALIEGRAFDPGTAPWVDLVSVTRSIDHLFLRYRFEPQPRN